MKNTWCKSVFVLFSKKYKYCLISTHSNFEKNDVTEPKAKRLSYSDSKLNY